MQPSQQGLFLQDNWNKGQKPYVLIKTTQTSQYLDQFLTILHATFTTGLIFVSQLKQEAATMFRPKLHVPIVKVEMQNHEELVKIFRSYEYVS